MIVTVRLIKPSKGTVITYQGRLLHRTTTSILLHARWEHPLTDLGCVVFAPGDHLYEHFYNDRWYNVYELRTIDDRRKGWYCNMTRPAIFGDQTIESEDLELDLFVAPDRLHMQVLDQAEYIARGFAITDPALDQAVQAALLEVQQLARQGAGPFADGAIKHITGEVMPAVER